MRHIAKYKCPYCGHENTKVLTQNTNFEIIYCDCEEGGCERPFAIKSILEITDKSEVFALISKEEIDAENEILESVGEWMKENNIPEQAI